MLPVIVYKGKEKGSGELLSIIYLGWDNRIGSYWANRLLDEFLMMKKSKKIPVWRILKYLGENKENNDLVLAEMNSLTRRFVTYNHGFMLPRWLEMQLIAEDMVNGKAKNDILRLVRKHSLTYRKGLPESEFKFFYTRMFMPNLKCRHGDSAVYSKYGYMLSQFRKKGSQLCFVYKYNEPVAGLLTELKFKKWRLRSIGILDGREDLLKMGVTGAIYYFEMLDSFKKGIKAVNIGGTSPVLTDGLTRFKLRLGAMAEDIKFFDDLTLMLRILKDSSAVRSLLKLNPFVYRNKKKLYRAMFVDPDDYEDKYEFLRFFRHTQCKNIQGTKIYCFDKPEKITGWIKEEDDQNIQVFSYYDLII
ncbi:MAG: hypothetical protein JW723_14180 [Bacteroidales bacterium]|nr:hypothetical protein [Bacteroidales bacterium]